MDISEGKLLSPLLLARQISGRFSAAQRAVIARKAEDYSHKETECIAARRSYDRVGGSHRLLTKGTMQFGLFSLAVLLLFHQTLRQLISFAYSSDLFFYILLVPLVSGYFIYSRKENAFSGVAPSYTAGALVVACGCGLYLIGRNWKPPRTQDDILCLTTASILLIWVGGLIFFYGVRTFRNLAFPLCFLFLMIPLPSSLLGQIVVLLQKGSAEATYWIIKATGLPVARHGFVFSLSKIEFEVAPQCSGIRSGLYLFMTGLVFSQLYLKSHIRRSLLVLSVLPIVIFKNGLRIATLTLLANYVNKSILSSDLHRKGGIPFMIVGIVLLAMLTRWLGRKERRLFSAANAESSDRDLAAAKSL